MNLFRNILVSLCFVYGSAIFTVKIYNEDIEIESGITRSKSQDIANNTQVEEANAINKLAKLTPGSDETLAVPPPPSPDDAARMARFIVHYTTWGSLSHISHQPQMTGAPLARVYSLSDGPIQASSGIPYFYLTPNDPELQDMFTDPLASLTLTLAQTQYCKMNSYDPEDPRCAQVILTGKLVVLKNSTAEWLTAQQALFSRHPVMRKWPESHHWVCCKLEISRILVADNFGGNKYPSVDQYFRAHPNICSHQDPLMQMAFY